ncbi:hypothetical protein BH20CHL7_BH20CHL7_00950 [soil metagenome]
MQPLSDREAMVAFGPEWCLVWTHHVRPGQFAIWAPYVRRSRHRIVVMASADIVADQVRSEIAEMPRVAVAEPYDAAVDWLRDVRGFRGFLYVGSFPTVAALMEAFPGSTHIWIGHGESAKKANTHRTASAFDSVFVADYRAVGRYPRAIRGWLMEGACAIGVPVVEGLRADPWVGTRRIRRIVYAPTFEGRTARADYTSIDLAAPAITEAMPILRERGVDVIVRPHPSTGGRRPEVLDRLGELYAAGAIPGGDKAADLNTADLLIGDVSGASSEFLFTRKPVLMPVFPRLVELLGGTSRLHTEYPWADRWQVQRESLVDRLAVLERSDPLSRTRTQAAGRLFRDHRTVEDAVRTFDLALDAATRRSSRVPVRIAFEVRRWMDRGRARADPATDPGRRRVSSPSRGAPVGGADATGQDGGSADGRSRGDGGPGGDG